MNDFNNVGELAIWIIIMFIIYLIVGFFAIYLIPTLLDILAYNIMVMVS